jgi:ABC-type glycerol-3-phosphate transport system substrate-binding protein
MKKLLVAVASAAILTACGGGGGAPSSPAADGGTGPAKVFSPVSRAQDVASQSNTHSSAIDNQIAQLDPDK